MDVERQAAVVAARDLAAGLLVPAAERVDRTEVPASHLRAIGRAGLLGLQAPAGLGGSAAPPPVVRRVTELLAGADCATWFVQAQHHSPLALLSRSPGPAQDRYARRLATGELLCGVAFSHLRRWPERPVTATREAAGWRFDGAAPWYTGWGLSQVMLLAGATDAGEVVFGMVAATAGEHLHASGPLAMAALSATRTVRLALDGLRVADADVVTVVPIGEWAERDAAVTADVNPAVLGLTERTVTLLAETGTRRGEPETVACAKRLAASLEDVRGRCYRLLDGGEAAGGLAERRAARADAGHLAVEATSALVAAGSGGAMSLDAPGQRLAREALFLLVQAQSAAVRSATLRRWAR